MSKPLSAYIFGVKAPLVRLVHLLAGLLHGSLFILCIISPETMSRAHLAHAETLRVDKAQHQFRSANLQSPYNAYFMAVLSTLAYTDLGITQSTYQRLQLKPCSGRESLKLVDSAQHNTSAHLSTDGTRTFLIMRGTDDLDDLWQNVKQDATVRAGWGSIPIHHGFSELSEQFITSTRLLDLLRRCGEDQGLKREVYLGGHSLGGALANILAVELKRHAVNVRGIYTYGTPRVGGTAWVQFFTRMFPGQSFQWRHPHDPITQVPQGPLKSSKDGHGLSTAPADSLDSYTDLPQLFLGDRNATKVLVENLNPFDGKGSFSYHNKKHYVFALWERAQRAEGLSDTLSPRNLFTLGKVANYCSHHLHCGVGQYCSTIGKNRCKLKKSIGQLCLKGVMCQSARCVMGRCATPQDLRAAP